MSSATPGAATQQPGRQTPVAAPSAGAPDAGSRIGHDVATAPSQPASAPKLNLDLQRPRGGELARRGSTGGVLPVMPLPPELPTKLAKDLEKNIRPDCRTAYADRGLAAVAPLAADALKDSGCKW